MEGNRVWSASCGLAFRNTFSNLYRGNTFLFVQNVTCGPLNVDAGGNSSLP
ncbi:MAG: hypothetical protein ACREAA_09360 [Candidatus Polarisedimenticolia bacterium]